MFGQLNPGNGIETNRRNRQPPAANSSRRQCTDAHRYATGAGGQLRAWISPRRQLVKTC
jgi:hypothetical protein